MNEKDNEELLAGWLSTFSSDNSKYPREHTMGRVLASISQPVVEMGHDDFMCVFKAWNENPKLTLSTKQQYWRQFKSYVGYVQEVCNMFLNFPKKTVHWGKNNKKSTSSKDFIMTVPQVNSLVDRIMMTDFKKGIMVMMQADTGMRSRQLCTIQTDWVHNDERWTEAVPKGLGTHGDGSNETFAYSERVQRAMNQYLKARALIEPNNPYLFTGYHESHVSVEWYEKYIVKIHGDLPITSHSFRRTINNLRHEMGCSLEDRAFLLCQLVGNVNSDKYTKMKPEAKVKLYDQYYPY